MPPPGPPALIMDTNCRSPRRLLSLLCDKALRFGSFEQICRLPASDDRRPLIVEALIALHCILFVRIEATAFRAAKRIPVWLAVARKVALNPLAIPATTRSGSREYI